MYLLLTNNYFCIQELKPITTLLSDRTLSAKKVSLRGPSTGVSPQLGNSACCSLLRCSLPLFSSSSRLCSLERARDRLWELTVSLIRFVFWKPHMTLHNCLPMALPSRKDSATSSAASSVSARSFQLAPSERTHSDVSSVTKPSVDFASMNLRLSMHICIFVHASRKTKLIKLHVKKTSSVTNSWTMPLFKNPNNAGPFRKMRSTGLLSFWETVCGQDSQPTLELTPQSSVHFMSATVSNRSIYPSWSERNLKIDHYFSLYYG